MKAPTTAELKRLLERHDPEALADGREMDPLKASACFRFGDTWLKYVPMVRALLERHLALLEATGLGDSPAVFQDTVIPDTLRKRSARMVERVAETWEAADRPTLPSPSHQIAKMNEPVPTDVLRMYVEEGEDADPDHVESMAAELAYLRSEFAVGVMASALKNADNDLAITRKELVEVRSVLAATVMERRDLEEALDVTRTLLNEAKRARNNAKKRCGESSIRRRCRREAKTTIDAEREWYADIGRFSEAERAFAKGLLNQLERDLGTALRGTLADGSGLTRNQRCPMDEHTRSCVLTIDHAGPHAAVDTFDPNAGTWKEKK